MANISYNIKSGAAPFYAYLIKDNNVVDTEIHNNIGEYSFTNIDGGTYKLEVVDSNECTKVFEDLIIDPDAPNVTTIPASEVTMNEIYGTGGDNINVPVQQFSMEYKPAASGNWIGTMPRTDPITTQYTFSITGLTSGTVYNYRARILTDNGIPETVLGNILQVTTLGAPTTTTTTTVEVGCEGFVVTDVRTYNICDDNFEIGNVYTDEDAIKIDVVKGESNFTVVIEKYLYYDSELEEEVWDIYDTQIYSITPPATITYDGLPNGTYRTTITDDNGCFYESGTLTINVAITTTTTTQPFTPQIETLNVQKSGLEALYGTGGKIITPTEPTREFLDDVQSYGMFYKTTSASVWQSTYNEGPLDSKEFNEDILGLSPNTTYNIASYFEKDSVVYTGNTKTFGTTVITIDWVDDWYLPTSHELLLIYDTLWVGSLPSGQRVGDFESNFYHSSTMDNTIIRYKRTRMCNFHPFGEHPQYSKKVWLATRHWIEHAYVRPCRKFVSNRNLNLRDSGPADGWIYHKEDIGNSLFIYHEVAKEDVGWQRFLDDHSTKRIRRTKRSLGYGQDNTDIIIEETAINKRGATQTANKYRTPRIFNDMGVIV